jgi:hypothetical protein
MPDIHSQLADEESIYIIQLIDNLLFFQAAYLIITEAKELAKDILPMLAQYRCGYIMRRRRRRKFPRREEYRLLS